MTLAGRVWNSIESGERLELLQHCAMRMSDSLRMHESTLTWDSLLPSTQEDLLEVDFSEILGRDVTP